MRIIDLSYVLEDVLGEPDKVTIHEITHEEGARVLGAYGGNIDKNDFPDGIAINNEKITLSTHTGTHIDAPYHFSPYTNGKCSKKIKDVPLEWFFGKGKLIDLSDSDNEEPVSEEEIKQYLCVNDIRIQANDIVLINTGAQKHWGTEKYFTHYRGVSEKATEYILNCGVNVIGIDSFGFDPPFHKMINNYKSTKDKKFLWPSHVLGRRKEYCHIERLANLAELTSYQNNDFYISCFPIKLNLGAAWIRAVAIVFEVDEGCFYEK